MNGYGENTNRRAVASWLPSAEQVGTNLEQGRFKNAKRRLTKVSSAFKLLSYSLRKADAYLATRWCLLWWRSALLEKLFLLTFFLKPLFLNDLSPGGTNFSFCWNFYRWPCTCSSVCSQGKSSENSGRGEWNEKTNNQIFFMFTSVIVR